MSDYFWKWMVETVPAVALATIVLLYMWRTMESRAKEEREDKKDIVAAYRENAEAQMGLIDAIDGLASTVHDCRGVQDRILEAVRLVQHVPGNTKGGVQFEQEGEARTERPGSPGKEAGPGVPAGPA